MSLKITPFTGGLVGTNGYLVEGPQGIVVIDAPAGIAERIPSGRHPLALLLTHQHFDHVEDVAALASRGVPVYAHHRYDPGLVLDEAARHWGMPVTIPPFEVDHVLAGQMKLGVGGLNFSLRHVPGHSPDSLCFFLPAEGVLFGGDSVFAGSVGRTDLPGGQPGIFREAIRTGILSLPEETVIYPGHGPRTTVGREAASNPFLS